MIPLSKVISQVESSGNPFAIRFEPAYTPNATHVSQMRSLAGCNDSTAKILCACSWGEFQFMGTTLIDMGLDISPIEFASRQDLQLSFFAKFCVQRDIDFPVDELRQSGAARLKFATAYNGPGQYAQAYANRILAVINDIVLSGS